MNIGVGIDIEEIKRFKNLKKHQLNKMFTKEELEYCFKKKNVAQSLAVRFAGKEAVIKALHSIGKRDPLIQSFKEIKILKIDGVPEVVLPKEMRYLKTVLSLSHSNDKAIAVAIVVEEMR